MKFSPYYITSALKSTENAGFFCKLNNNKKSNESELRDEMKRRRRRDEEGRGSVFPVGGGCSGAAGGALGSRFPAQMAEGLERKESCDSSSFVSKGLQA